MNRSDSQSILASDNAYYIEELYQLYLHDANAVDPSWQEVFVSLSKPLAISNSITNDEHRDDHLIQKIIYDHYRMYGHFKAQLDPLKLSTNKHLFDAKLLAKQIELASNKAQIKQIQKQLEQIYCGSIGIEFMHLFDQKRKNWLIKQLEQQNITNNFSISEQKSWLKSLIAAEGLERYLAMQFPAAKRFSLEGADVLLPMLQEVLSHSAKQQTNEVHLGMAHRGRLNVLVNLLGKKSQDLFDSFAGKMLQNIGSGDVKYHQGIFAKLSIAKQELTAKLVFNPSHLELINPVVMGSARAKIDQQKKVLAVTIHGDSAIVAQGVVAETFNLSQTRGFGIGGALRIVINNQIGFTTSNASDVRSNVYCTDIAKMLQVPIFHVNADDVQAVVAVTRLALDYRKKFKTDVIIDLVGYRRNGHHEADEPSATQPLMYQQIKQHQTVRSIYAQHLVNQQIVTTKDVDSMISSYRKKLDQGLVVAKNVITAMAMEQWQDSTAQTSTAPTDLNQLIKIGKAANSYPVDFILHDRLTKIYQDRLIMLEQKKGIDWGMAEILAYANVLAHGKNVRLSGQDVGRGTFFHRHGVLHDQNNGNTYIPLQNIEKSLKHDHNVGNFHIYDSVLSECAVLAFEYGYALASKPNSLTIWEAQFGDFANGAQAIFDQLLSSSEQKWGELCGLTVLLPHGYEGQGPEHSSARIERYLQLCAEQNMQVIQPSTPVQMYHAILRQANLVTPKPLIIITPKSLLRHPLCVSNLNDFIDHEFKNVVVEPQLIAEQVERVIFCSGKIYYDLIRQRVAMYSEADDCKIAIVRIEQLYPFPAMDIAQSITIYPNVIDYIWCQDEPKNQGAWLFFQDQFNSAQIVDQPLGYVGRDEAAATATGYMSTHVKEQQQLLKNALTI